MTPPALMKEGDISPSNSGTRPYSGGAGHGRRSKQLLRTPPSCPFSCRWRNKIWGVDWETTPQNLDSWV